MAAQEATAAEGMAKALSWEEVMKVEAKVTAAMVESDVGLLFRSCDMEAKRAGGGARDGRLRPRVGRVPEDEAV